MDHSGRRAALTALLAVLLAFAGCTAALDGAGGGTDTPTTVPPSSGMPSGTPTATPGECVAVGPATVDPFREGVEPSGRPEPPDEWNRSSVERYVVAFEAAYARNAALRVNTREASVIVGDVSVDRRDGTWIVDLTSRTNTWVQGRATGTATATVVHGDGARVPVTYRLTDRALYRVEGSPGGTLSGGPTRTPEQGRPVACFDN